MKRMKLLSVVAIVMALIFTGTVSMPVLASDTGGDQNAVSEEVQVVEEDDKEAKMPLTEENYHPTINNK